MSRPVIRTINIRYSNLKLIVHLDHLVVFEVLSHVEIPVNPKQQNDYLFVCSLIVN